MSFPLFATFFLLFGTNIKAQEAPCKVNFSFSVECDRVVVTYSGNSDWPTHYWDFGDGTIIGGGPTFNEVKHVYKDIDFTLDSNIIARHSQDSITWCERVITFPRVFIGDGCGSSRKISDLVANGLFPADTLASKTINIFGNLIADIPYTFDNCVILMGNGGKIEVKNTSPNQSLNTLTISNTSEIYNHTFAGTFGSCNDLWNGIFVESGTKLIVNSAVFQNAHYGIVPVHNDQNKVPPMLSLNGLDFYRTFIGIYAANGPFELTDFSGVGFYGSQSDILPVAGTCIPVAPIQGIPYLGRTYCGIYARGESTSIKMPLGSAGNTFKNLQAGIVSFDANLTISGCQFEDIRKVPSPYDGPHSMAVYFKVENNTIPRFHMSGLGKNADFTIKNIERGIDISTLMGMTEVSVVDCYMDSVQIGMFLDEGGQGVMGNFSKVSILNNKIRCNKYDVGLSDVANGIMINDPNPTFSKIKVQHNNIMVAQNEALDIFWNISKGTNGIHVIAQNAQASLSTLSLDISSNNIKLNPAFNGIRIENTISAEIYDNVVEITSYPTQLGGVAIAGINTVNGKNNMLDCNDLSCLVLASNQDISAGTFTVNSVNAKVRNNKTSGSVYGIFWGLDNGTGCIVGYNQMKSNGTGELGLFYGDAITGPQYYKANVWEDTFILGGAGYAYSPTGSGFTNCQSTYRVNNLANIGAGTPNPVLIRNKPIGSPCTDSLWIHKLSGQEYFAYSCLRPFPNDETTYPINPPDLFFGDGGGSTLSPGYRWSTETNLYGKLLDYPLAAAQEPITSAFLLAQGNQSVGQAYAVRLGTDLSAAVPSNLNADLNALDLSISNLEVQIAAALNSSPVNIGSWQNLSQQRHTLLAQRSSLLGQINTLVNSKAAQTLAANNAIVCNTLPCTYEKNLTQLFLETRILTPRNLSTQELAQIAAIAVQCPETAGSMAFWARSWYYLATGQYLGEDCSVLFDRGAELRSKVKNEKQQQFSLWPNPANDALNAQFDPLPNGGKLTLFDIFGHQLHCTRLSPESRSASISTHLIPTGTYLLRLTDDSGRLLTTQRVAIVH